jgi:hypothetical protein
MNKAGKQLQALSEICGKRCIAVAKAVVGKQFHFQNFDLRFFPSSSLKKNMAPAPIDLSDIDFSDIIAKCAHILPFTLHKLG